MFFVAASQETPAETLGGERDMYLGNIILPTSGQILNLEKQVRRVLGQINPELPVIDFFPFAQQVQGSLDQQQMIAQLMTISGNRRLKG